MDTAVAGADPQVVGPYLARVLGDPGWERPTVELIAGGKSNLTYRIDGPRIPLVLRRPPLGHVLASAHDMHREHRVISALRDCAVPVPRAIDFVDDTSAAEVTGTPFFVMEFVDGLVLTRPRQNAQFTADAVTALEAVHASAFVA